MRWSLIIAVFGLSTLDVASLAQGPPDGERSSPARSASDDAGFFAPTGVVRFQLVQARLCLDAPRHRKGSQNCDEGGVYESITVTAERGIPSLHYVCQSDSHHLTLSVQQAAAMRIESWFPDTGERSVLDQPEFGAVTWVHSLGDLNDEYEGTNLLHLRHANAALFDQHFGVLIQRLLHGRSLASLSEATQRVMLRELETESALDESQIRNCVEQFRSARRRERVNAERQLLSWGTPIIPSLHTIYESDVDAEQRERMRMIMRRLRPLIDDTPSTLAKLFVNDRSYWDRIATGLSNEQLQAANHHLRGFGIEPVELATGDPVHRIATSRD